MSNLPIELAALKPIARWQTALLAGDTGFTETRIAEADAVFDIFNEKMQHVAGLVAYMEGDYSFAVKCALSYLIGSFNYLNNKYGLAFIETGEREEIFLFARNVVAKIQPQIDEATFSELFEAHFREW